MKKIVLLLFMLSATYCIANEQQLCLVILAKDNSQIVYSLSEEPKITFSPTEMLVKTPLAEMTYPLDNIVKYTYENKDVTSVVNINDQSPISMKDNMLLFNNLQKGGSINVYNPAGALVGHYTVSSDGTYSLPIDNLTQGIYVIDINGLTFKLLKK